VFIVWLGVYPKTFLDKSAGAAKHVVQQIEDARKGVIRPLPVTQMPGEGKEAR